MAIAESFLEDLKIFFIVRVMSYFLMKTTTYFNSMFTGNSIQVMRIKHDACGGCKYKCFTMHGRFCFDWFYKTNAIKETKIFSHFVHGYGTFW